MVEICSQRKRTGEVVTSGVGFIVEHHVINFTL